jgi:hypothetical protein
MDHRLERNSFVVVRRTAQSKDSSLCVTDVRGQQDINPEFLIFPSHYNQITNT